MVKKLGILGIILIATAAATMAWAGTDMGAIPAPQPTVMPAAAPAAACVVGQPCAPAPVAKMKPKPAPKLVTTIDVKMQYPQQPVMPCGPVMAASCGAGPAPIPVAVPMWKFVVPWPPFVYYLPVE